MLRRCIVSLLVVLLTAWSTSTFAAPRDRAATDKIKEAINSYYLATEFDKAEGILKGTIDACEDRCSPSVKAQAWMYVGIVRGSGKQDLKGAQDAFQQALALDPNVKLDDALATPQVQQAFANAAAALGQAVPQGGGGGGQTTPPAGGAPPGGGAAEEGEDVEGEMECTPSVREVETHRPIPVACTTEEPATKVVLRYKAFGGETWQSVPMQKKGEYWQAEIPCADTGISGALSWFVRATDRGGDTVDSHGTKKKPATINLVDTTKEKPPSYPGQAAPQKCMGGGECPEDMIGTPACPGTGGGARGNKGWGTPCDKSQECDVGLLCTQGDNGRTCETAPSCTGDSDCPPDAACMSGTCDLAAGGGGGSSGGPYKKNWVGIHGGLDIVYMSGKGVCSQESQKANDFNCFYSDGSQFLDYTTPTGGGEVNGGLIPGTFRLMLSYERALTENIGAEARFGFAFRGGPKPNGGSAFLPIHAEVRGKYWFGSNPYGRVGFRPYVFLGGGLAQVDAKLTIAVETCVDNAGNPIQCTPTSKTNGLQLDAYKKLGLMFVAGGGGLKYALTDVHGIVLNVNLMYMLPSSGIVVEPSLGYEFGF